MRRFVRNAFDMRSRQPNTGPEPSHGLDNPNQLDRMPSTSKALDRASMSPVEAKQELDASLTSKADLLQTEDYPPAQEKPSSSASTPSGDTSDEVCGGCSRCLGLLLWDFSVQEVSRFCSPCRASPTITASFLRSPS